MCNYKLKHNVHCEFTEQDAVCERIASSITPGCRELWDGECVPLGIASYARLITPLLYEKRIIL